MIDLSSKPARPAEMFERSFEQLLDTDEAAALLKGGTREDRER